MCDGLDCLKLDGCEFAQAPATQAEYVDARCAAGYPVDYRTYEGRDHVPLVEPDSPAVRDILTWTTDRFDNKPAKNTC